MLKINLLPGYVAQRRLTNRLLTVFVTLFILITVGLTTYDLILYRQIGPLTELSNEADATKQQIDSLNSQAAAATASLAPIQANVQFITDSQNYNLQYIKLYQTLARYTSKRILYNSTTVAGNVMTISAYTPSIADLGRYLQVMYTEPDASAVSISAIPGYGTQNPDTADNVSLPVGVQGHLPGVSQPINSFTVYRGQIIKVNSGGSAGGGGRAGAGMQAGFAGAPAGGMAMPGLPSANMSPMASTRGTALGGAIFDAHHDGFPVTVTLTLKQALSPPTPPGTVAGASGSGGTAFSGQPGGLPPGAPGGARPGAPMAPMPPMAPAPGGPKP